MKVHEALVRAFREEGINTVFGIMGNANMQWWTAMDATGAKVHSTRHEGSAVTMAEGWARATGQPGCATVTNGPGVTQLGTALAVASRARVPLVVFGGDGDLGSRHELQYLDQRRFVEATDAVFISLLTKSGIEETVREAFYVARSKSCPVFLNVPKDLQEEEIDDDFDYIPSTAMSPEPQRTLPNPDRLDAAVKLIASCQRPVLIVGQGSLSASETGIKKLADRIGALIATSLPMKGWGNDSPYYAGVSGLYATKVSIGLFSEADCVIGVGASLNHHTLVGGYLYGDASIIQIDLRPSLLLGNERPADICLQGDVQLTVNAINKALDDEGFAAKTGYRTSEVIELLKDSDPDPREFDLEPGTVDPRKAVMLIDEALPAEVGTVMGVAHSSAIATFFMTKQRKVQWYTSAFGCIGQSLITAIGGAVAFDGKPMAVIDGDASVLMHINELDTAARLGLNLLVVALNDGGWGAEYQKLVPKKNRPEAALIPTPDLGAVARAFGSRGLKINDLDEIKPAVEEFLSGQGPMLLDIRISKTVASVPYRRSFGEDI